MTVEYPPYMFSRLNIVLLFLVFAKEVLKDLLAREYKVTENATKVLKNLSKNDFQIIFPNTNKCCKCMQLPKRTTLNKML